MKTLSKFVGNKSFYKMVLLIAVPIMIQNGITNFVSLLDNIMIGQVGTEQMSGVAIVNQLFFVYNLCIFGGVSGAGIFTAQFFGQGSDEGVRQTMRFKLWMTAFITILASAVLLAYGTVLIRSYLKGDGYVRQAVFSHYVNRASGVCGCADVFQYTAGMWTNAFADESWNCGGIC